MFKIFIIAAVLAAAAASPVGRQLLRRLVHHATPGIRRTGYRGWLHLFSRLSQRDDLAGWATFCEESRLDLGQPLPGGRGVLLPHRLRVTAGLLRARQLSTYKSFIADHLNERFDQHKDEHGWMSLGTLRLIIVEDDSLEDTEMIITDADAPSVPVTQRPQRTPAEPGRHRAGTGTGAAPGVRTVGLLVAAPTGPMGPTDLDSVDELDITFAGRPRISATANPRLPGSLTQPDLPEPEPITEGWLTGIQGQQPLRLTRTTKLGRSPLARSGEAAFVVDDLRVSASHATLQHRPAGADQNGPAPAGWWIEDSGSLNGTTVNHRRTTRPARLEDGDLIGLSHGIQLRFHSTSPIAGN